MEAPILVAYATKHGSTGEVADALASILRRRDIAAEAVPAGRVSDLSRYGGVVLGGAIYIGRWHPDALLFLRRFADELRALPLAVFGMGPRTLDPDDVRGSRRQLDQALAGTDAEPRLVTVFGGVLQPAKLRFPFNRMPASDARDWDAVAAWAGDVARAFGYGKPAPNSRDDRRELQQTPR